MAILLFLLALGCFQFSTQELINTETVVQIEDEITLTPKDAPLDEMLDGANEDSWYKPAKEEKLNEDETPLLDGADKDSWYKGDDNDSWTKEDQDWLDKLQALFDSSEESLETEKIEDLIEKIEDFIEISHPEYKNYKWFLDIIDYFEKEHEDYDYEDYGRKQDTLNELYGKDEYYSWLLKQPKKENGSKRFSSV